MLLVAKCLQFGHVTRAVLLRNPPPSDPVLMTTVVFVRITLTIILTKLVWLTVNTATCGRVCVHVWEGECVWCARCACVCGVCVKCVGCV